MLDTYQRVFPTRISGEAPVMVAKHLGYTYAPGGAANAAVNVAHLGVDTCLLGFIGYDAAGDLLQQALAEQGIGSALLHPQGSRWETIEKRRIVDELGRHLLRVDTESAYTITEADRVRLYVARKKHQDCSVFFLSDYGKGTMDQDFVRHGIAAFKEQNKFVVVNGKPQHLPWYDGASVVIFNRAEAEAAVGESTDGLRGGVTEKLYDFYEGRVRDIVMTDGANGLYWCHGHTVRHFPAPKVEVADVGGAGDTIAATLAANGIVSPESLQLAIRNAAKVVSQRGTSVPK